MNFCVTYQVTNKALLELLNSLIACPSVTPNDAGCQDILIRELQNLGFACEQLNFGLTRNLWATRGPSPPYLVFAGHTDVVPAGTGWLSDPFKAYYNDNKLFGRGACDMKGALAAFIDALKQLDLNQLQRGIGLLITSDEEGSGFDGTSRALEVLMKRYPPFDCCLVGEPSSSAYAGDTLKIGRRGSLHGNLRLRGIQGHVAYHEKALNAIHLAMPLLNDLKNLSWQDGGEDFPDSNLEITQIHAGTGALNVVPGELTCQFNIRFSPHNTVAALKHSVEQCLTSHPCDFTLDWQVSSFAFKSVPGPLRTAALSACLQHRGQNPQLSTSGGTSDGRFFAHFGSEVVELGLCNASIHAANEHTQVDDLHLLSALYQDILKNLLMHRPELHPLQASGTS